MPRRSLGALGDLTARNSAFWVFLARRAVAVRTPPWCDRGLSQRWPRSMSPYGVTRPQWVNSQKTQPIPHPCGQSMGYLLWLQTDLLTCLNTLRPRQNGRHFPDDNFKCIFLNENVQISIKISLKFVPRDPINNIPALVRIMAWRQLGDKPLSEPMMVNLLTHICVTPSQWVKCWAKTLLRWDKKIHTYFNTQSPFYSAYISLVPGDVAISYCKWIIFRLIYLIGL